MSIPIEDDWRYRESTIIFSVEERERWNALSPEERWKEFIAQKKRYLEDS